MHSILRALGLALLALVMSVPAGVTAQPSTAESLSKTGLEKLADLQSAAQQFAQQQGQFAGRSVGPQLASASNQLLQVLLNFDVWACGTSVTALHLKRQRLAVAAAGMQPPDPALARAVDDFGRLISQLQELCDRYVHRIYGPPGSGAGAGTGTIPSPPPVTEPPAPTMSVQERICYQRCHDLYAQYLRAEMDYDRARRAAEAARQRAADARREADRAAERARGARQQAENSQREYDRLQAQMTASRNQRERLRIAEQLSHINPQGAREAADSAQRAANQAATNAQQAEQRAARSEAEANSLYDSMVEIYQAWERCARSCAEQARTIDRATIDIYRLFSAMPQSAPPPPAFYRPAPPPAVVPRQQAMAPLGRASARLLALHNMERAAVGAPPLRWNPVLAEHALAYANELGRTGQLRHSSREGRGIERENLSKGLPGWGPDQFMRSWIAEKRSFVAGLFPNVSRTGNWYDVGHYSQMIWPTTTDVGCAIARARAFAWLVCRYSPGGNKDGKPVGKPPSRPAASATPEDGLSMILETGDSSRVVGGEWLGPDPSRPGAEPPQSEPQPAAPQR
jgi:uncharacterized protein YkwD